MSEETESDRSTHPPDSRSDPRDAIAQRIRLPVDDPGVETCFFVQECTEQVKASLDQLQEVIRQSNAIHGETLKLIQHLIESNSSPAAAKLSRDLEAGIEVMNQAIVLFQKKMEAHDKTLVEVTAKARQKLDGAIVSQIRRETFIANSIAMVILVFATGIFTSWLATNKAYAQFGGRAVYEFAAELLNHSGNLRRASDCLSQKSKQCTFQLGDR